MKWFIDWVKRQPVLATRLLDAFLIALGVTLHKYGVDIAAEWKTFLDIILLSIAGAGTVVTRDNVVPAVKLSEPTLARAANMTTADIARVEAVKVEAAKP